MMLDHFGDEFESVSESHVCEHHQRYPFDVDYAACTCSTSYNLRRKEISNFRRYRNVGQARLLEVLRLNAAKIRKWDLRVGQLIVDAIHLKYGHSDPFNIEDDDLADAIEQFLNIAGREIKK